MTVLCVCVCVCVCVSSAQYEPCMNTKPSAMMNFPSVRTPSFRTWTNRKAAGEYKTPSTYSCKFSVTYIYIFIFIFIYFAVLFCFWSAQELHKSILINQTLNKI